MPKNAKKRKINIGSVNHVTTVTKYTTRGKKTSLIPVKPPTTPSIRAGSNTSSPSKTKHPSSNQTPRQLFPSYENPDMDPIDIRPLRLSQTKVGSNHSDVFTMIDGIYHMHNRHPMIISKIGYLMSRNTYMPYWKWKDLPNQGSVFVAEMGPTNVKIASAT